MLIIFDITEKEKAVMVGIPQLLSGIIYNLCDNAIKYNRAGSKLNSLLGKLTGNKWAGLLTGLGITAIIQSSSATTVMVVGFVWSDILTDLERVSDHCSNIAGCVIDSAEHNLNVHESLRATRDGNEKYDEMFREYSKKYSVFE